jgi:hypothetical protein
MKALALLCLAACIGLFSCTKDSSSPKPSVSASVSPLIGTWHVVSDTTHSQWIANASNPTGNYVSVYTGKASDYYAFDASGAFTISQNNNTNFGTYTLKDNELNLIYPLNSANYHVSQLTDHSAVLVFSAATPGGPMTDIITLTK